MNYYGNGSAESADVAFIFFFVKFPNENLGMQGNDLELGELEDPGGGFEGSKEVITGH